MILKDAQEILAQSNADLGSKRAKVSIPYAKKIDEVLQDAERRSSDIYQEALEALLTAFGSEGSRVHAIIELRKLQRKNFDRVVELRDYLRGDVL